MTAVMDKSQDKVLEKSDKSGHHQSPVGQGTDPPCRHSTATLHIWDSPLVCRGMGVGWAVQGSGGQQNIIPTVYFSTKITLESAKQKLGTFLCIQGRDWSVCIGALWGGRGSTDVLQLLSVTEQQAGTVGSSHNKAFLSLVKVAVC